MIGSGNVDPSVLAKVKTWAPYVDAKLGFHFHAKSEHFNRIAGFFRYHGQHDGCGIERCNW